MVDLIATFGIPLNIGGAVALLVQASLAALVIVIVNKVVAQSFELEVKSAFIMAVGSYFLTPLVFLGLASAGMTFPSLVALYIVPLLVWIVLGEVLLHSYSTMEKAKVAIVAFVAYSVLQSLGIVAFITSYIPI
jgi:hypothetical protein